MRITLHNKRIQVCFLLCSLLFLECFGYGIFSLAPWGASGVNELAASSSSFAGQHSAMSDSIKANLDVMGALDGTGFIIASAGNARGLGFSPNYLFSAVISALLLAGLLNYLRLSQQIYIQFDSLQITAFLHKKDGKK